MIVLDLFSGLEGWATAFRARGHQTVTLDFDPKFNADHVLDILTVDRLEELEPTRIKGLTRVSATTFDVICASPPCEAFSTGSIGRHWGGGARAYEPKSDAARVALSIVKQTFRLVDEYRDRHPDTLYVVENPRGVMRKITPRRPTAETWYCQWGESRAKPTDLWTNIDLFPQGWPKCRNGNPDHDAQSRYYAKRKALGQTGGTQGLPNAELRALIPAKLAEAIARGAEERHVH